MTDVTRHNFEEVCPRISQILENCSFIAIDTEFTALSNSKLKMCHQVKICNTFLFRVWVDNIIRIGYLSNVKLEEFARCQLL